MFARPPRKKRILFISHEASLTGAPLFLHNLLTHCHAACPRYEITVHYVKDGPLVATLRQEGIRVAMFEKGLPSAGRFTRALHRFFYALRLVWLLIRFRPDLVYSNTILNFSQVIMARVMGAKTLVHMHEGSDLAAKLRTKFRISSMFTTQYIVGSQYAGSVLKRLVGKDGLVIHNGIDVLSCAAASPVEKKAAINLSVIGTVDRNKGQLIAIKAVEYLARTKKQDVHLNIIGRVTEAQYGEEVQAYIRSNGLNSIITLWGQAERMAPLYAAADAVIVSSHDEVFPTVILEAMAYRRPVVASNTGGIPEIVKNEETGLLFKRGDFLDLADKIAVLFSEAELRTNLVSKAFTNICGNFSLNDSNRKIMQAVDDLMGSSNDGVPLATKAS